MTRYSLICLLLGSLSWGQATSSESATGAQKPAATTTAAPQAASSSQGRQAKALNVASDAPLITITGLCDHPSADKTTASDCKTVITQAQFAAVIEAIQPNMPARNRREFALSYADALVMTRKAEQMGLDKGVNYEEQMKLARIQILSKVLNQAIQEKVAKIPDKDIEDYYHNNIKRFEKAQMERIYVPKTRQSPTASDGQTMREEADHLFARAVAGEEFTTLQANAYRVAGIKSAVPGTTLEVRRISLPPDQASVMDLKPGDVSAVLADPNGYVIYKVKIKSTLPLDQAREEIKATLRSQRLKDEMDGIRESAVPTLDENYFLPARPQ